MKQEIIWNLEDLLDSHVNVKLDLDMDLKNTELYYMKSTIRSNMQMQNKKIRELRKCIKWIKSIK